MQRLVSQLSSSARAPRGGQVAALVSYAEHRPDSGALAGGGAGGHDHAGHHGGFVTGMRCYIEDVVVDARHRRQGLAQAMMQEAVVMAEEAGARTLDLSSRPSSEAANNLYVRDRALSAGTPTSTV